MRPTEQCLARIRVRALRSVRPITLGTTHRTTGVAAEAEVGAEVAAEVAAVAGVEAVAEVVAAEAVAEAEAAAAAARRL